MNVGEGRRFAATVQDVTLLGELLWLTLEVPDWPGAEPGQFAMLQAEPSAHFLARPLSVALDEGTQVSFLVAPVGPGTRELCRLRPGDGLGVLGPLGVGFPLGALATPEGGRSWLVGGGAGVAPLPLLLRHLTAYRRGRVGVAGNGAHRDEEHHPKEDGEVVVLLGFRTARQAAAAAPVTAEAALLTAAGTPCRVLVTTEDGSVGERGLVTDLLGPQLRPGDRLAVCGPEAMAEAVWAACSAVDEVQAWFSLETTMACGVGSCHGCVITLADGTWTRVCAEGPVFAGGAVWGRGIRGSSRKEEGGEHGC